MSAAYAYISRHKILNKLLYSADMSYNRYLFDGLGRANGRVVLEITETAQAVSCSGITHTEHGKRVTQIQWNQYNSNDALVYQLSMDVDNGFVNHRQDTTGSQQ